MLPKHKAWVKAWPDPHSFRDDRDGIVAWLESAPSNIQIEGPMNEWGHFQTRDSKKFWTVDEYRSGQSPTRVGEFTSEELFDRWKEYGLGWLVVRPSLTTDALHRIVTTTDW